MTLKSHTPTLIKTTGHRGAIASAARDRSKRLGGARNRVLSCATKARTQSVQRSTLVRPSPFETLLHRIGECSGLRNRPTTYVESDFQPGSWARPDPYRPSRGRCTQECRRESHTHPLGLSGCKQRDPESHKTNSQQHWFEAHSTVTPGVQVAVNEEASQRRPLGQQPMMFLKVTQLVLGCL